MYKSTDSEHQQLSFFQFNASCGMQLNSQNEWVKDANRLPWKVWEASDNPVLNARTCYLHMMHTLFTLEDWYGLTIETKDGEVLFHFDPRKGQDAARISEMVYAWAPVMEKYRNGEITKEEYDNWRYNYPRDDKTQIWAHVPSAGLMDSIIEGMKK